MKTKVQVRWAHIAAGVIAWAGIIQFGLAVRAAIVAYPGGQYSMGRQFLSDLGATRAAGGESNSESARLFNRAAVLLGLSAVPFFLLLPSTLPAEGKPRYVRAMQWALGAAGAASALGLVGIGLTPYDVYFVAHCVALALWLAPMLLLAVVWLLVCVRHERASLGLLSVTLFLVFASLLYGLSGPHGYAVFQKLVVATAIVWFALLFLQVSAATVTVVTTSSRVQHVERQAARYMAELQRRPRK